HVVLARDGIGGRDARHAFHLLGHLECAPRRRVDEYVRLHRLTPNLFSGRNRLSVSLQRLFFRVRLSARCWASFLMPGFTDTTLGPRTFLSRALLRALSRGATRSSSSLKRLRRLRGRSPACGCRSRGAFRLRDIRPRSAACCPLPRSGGWSRRSCVPALSAPGV